MRSEAWLLVIAILLGFISPLVYAFKINPLSEYNDEKNKYVKIEKTFPSPVHENFTVRSLDKIDPNLFQQAKKQLLNEIVRGVRWNDDPLMMLSSEMVNFGVNYAHSCHDDIKYKINQKWDYLYRTHCGDMQYLHAMASSKEEKPHETLHKIFMWLEFTYKVSSGAIPTNRRLRSVHLLMTEDNSELFYDEIVNNGGKYKCEYDKSGAVKSCAEVETIFSFECKRVIDWPFIWKTKPRCNNVGDIDEVTIRNIALGSALHLLQDSMSDSHVARERQLSEYCSPENRDMGVIKYHNYNDQKSSLHSKADKIICKQSTGDINIVDIGAKIINWSLLDRQEGIDRWESKVVIYLKDVIFTPFVGDYKEEDIRKYDK